MRRNIKFKNRLLYEGNIVKITTSWFCESQGGPVTRTLARTKFSILDRTFCSHRPYTVEGPQVSLRAVVTAPIRWTVEFLRCEKKHISLQKICAASVRTLWHCRWVTSNVQHILMSRAMSPQHFWKHGDALRDEMLRSGKLSKRKNWVANCKWLEFIFSLCERFSTPTMESNCLLPIWRHSNWATHQRPTQLQIFLWTSWGGPRQQRKAHLEWQGWWNCQYQKWGSYDKQEVM